jgi:hypothetical protein
VNPEQRSVEASQLPFKVCEIEVPIHGQFPGQGTGITAVFVLATAKHFTEAGFGLGVGERIVRTIKSRVVILAPLP